MKKIICGIMFALLLFVGLSFVGNHINAQTIETGDLGLQYAEPIGLGNADIRLTISSIIRTALSLLGIVAVVIIIYGGFRWMTAGGNDDQVGEAKKWIYSGIIGLAIILSAYALAAFIIDSLVGATTDVAPIN